VVTGDSVPLQAPIPPVPPPPTPHLPPAPVAPSSASSSGPVLSGSGHDDEPGSDLGIMTAEVATVHVWAPTGCSAGFAGHVIRQAAETGSRPD
jgi:hypothetical protein